MSDNDEPITQLAPPGYDGTEFILPQLPTEPFMLSGDPDAAGGVAGPYRADEWEFEPLSNIGYRQSAGDRPKYLRVTDQDNMDLTTVDGDGNEHKRTIIVTPDNEMPDDGADAGSLTDAQRDAYANLTGAET